MIFENHFAGPGTADRPPPDRTARELLAACAQEAGRHAEALSRMDRALGAVLQEGPPDALAGTLQSLDLLRQEAEGLSRLLALVAAAPSPDALIEGGALARCVPLGAQRARLTS